MEKHAKVAVAMGGNSREREISLKTGRAIAKGLRQRGFSNLIEVDTQAHPTFYNEDWDAVFIALHGSGGEDGTLQSALEQRGIAFTGSGSRSSALAMSKYESKQIFAKNNIPTLPFFRTQNQWDGQEIQNMIEGSLTYPVIAKPDQEGSSIGLEIIESASGLGEALERLQKFSQIVLWEGYMQQGVDLTVGILNEKALPVIEIRPKEGWYDFDAKYTQGMTEYICPARIDQGLTRRVQDLAVQAFQALACRSWGRVDFIWKDNQVHCLEVNTVPGMTPTSLVPMAAAQNDISFDHLVERILMDAMA